MWRAGVPMMLCKEVICTSCRKGIQLSDGRWRWIMALMIDRAVQEQRWPDCAMPAS